MKFEPKIELTHSYMWLNPSTFAYEYISEIKIPIEPIQDTATTLGEDELHRLIGKALVTALREQGTKDGIIACPYIPPK